METNPYAPPVAPEAPPAPKHLGRLGRILFTLAGLALCCGYGYFALLGVYLGKIQYRRYLPAGEAGQAIAGVEWIDAVRAALIASASTGIAAFYGHFLSNPASLIAG